MKHQPKLLTRPYSQVDPEFPCLPGIFLSDVQKFARKSQEALLSVQQGLPGTFPGNTVLYLPLISPHLLQPIFKVEENSVFVVVRKSYWVLKDSVESLNVKNVCGLYIRGPVGIGKSYLLYLLAAEYRLNRNSYRVTYLSDCGMWRRLPFNYLMQELATTFYDDIIESKSIVEWYQAVARSVKEDKMREMVEALVEYIHQNNLEWIVIFDQYNALFKTTVVKEFPFNLIDTLADYGERNVKVIISASTNNVDYPFKKAGWETFDIPNYRFDENEFKMWCDHYHLENGRVDPESQEAVDALFWTGGIPHELNLLWNKPKATLIEKTMLYRRDRIREMLQSHINFSDKFCFRDKLNLQKCISRMILRIAPPKGIEVMDRQLLDVVRDSDDNQIITALNPVARDALITYREKGLVACLDLVAGDVFDGPFTSETKMTILKKYITSMLELSHRFTFRSNKNRNSGRSTVLKMIKFRDIILFSGNNLPITFNQQVNTLFIPQSVDYPGLDFYIWDAVGQVLMAFQVTLQNPFTTNIDDDHCHKWLQFCFDGLNKKPIQIYWIIPKSCMRKQKIFKDFVLFFEDIYDDFPALKKLILK